MSHVRLQRRAVAVVCTCSTGRVLEAEGKALAVQAAYWQHMVECWQYRVLVFAVQGGGGGGEGIGSECLNTPASSFWRFICLHKHCVASSFRVGGREALCKLAHWHKHALLACFQRCMELPIVLTALAFNT